MNQEQTDIKNTIQKLIDTGSLQEANILIDQYQSIVPDDIEVYSMKAVVAILQNQYDQAYDSIQSGLDKDADNADLLYNLAYLYELKEEYQKSFDTYAKVLVLKPEDAEVAQTALEKLKKLGITAVSSPKKKLAIFVKEGLDSFLGDIIQGLDEDYDTKKIIVNDSKQIDDGMQWADICWFEWCDELVEYGSKHVLASK